MNSQSSAKPCKARILVVDDHPLMRDGLATQICSQPDLEVCGEAEDVEDALAVLERTPVDLAVIDIALKRGSGMELMRQIQARHPQVKMLVLSAHPESLYGQRCLRAGARGYLSKQQSRQHLIEAIRQVLDGLHYLSPQLTKLLLNMSLGGSEAAQGVEQLSDRELEVFRLVGQGVTTRAIANRLQLSVHTIDSYREHIKTKLGLSNATQLQQHAIEWVLQNL
jgi:DNA-binding NarL/FixJ family response regulator